MTATSDLGDAAVLTIVIRPGRLHAPGGRVDRAAVERPRVPTELEPAQPAHRARPRAAEPGAGGARSGASPPRARPCWTEARAQRPAAARDLRHRTGPGGLTPAAPAGRERTGCRSSWSPTAASRGSPTSRRRPAFSAVFAFPPAAWRRSWPAPARCCCWPGSNDPGNAGTLVRSAEAFGAAGVLFGRGGADPFAPKVVRAAMGSIFRLPVASVEADELLAAGGRRKAPVVAADVDGEDLRDRRRPARRDRRGRQRAARRPRLAAALGPRGPDPPARRDREFERRGRGQHRFVRGLALSRALSSRRKRLNCQDLAATTGGAILTRRRANTTRTEDRRGTADAHAHLRRILEIV